VHEFFFEGCEEALADGVVVAVAGGEESGLKFLEEVAKKPGQPFSSTSIS
jgi:hypothetical protein